VPRLRLRSLPALLALAVAGCLFGGLSGCAAVKAARQPEKKNLSVLRDGTPRTHVIAELNAPTYTRPRPDGTLEDVFSFKQGYTKGAKMGRAFAHGAADVATGGLWEVIGIPTEIWADGTDVQVVVTYDKDEQVKYVQVIKGQDAFQGRKPLLARARRGSKTQIAAAPPPPRNPARRPALAGQTPPSAPGSAMLSDAPEARPITPVSASLGAGGQGFQGGDSGSAH
jgi:hypothetical protein